MKIIKDSKIFRENIVKEINKYINNENNSINIEKSIFNYSIQE